MQYSEWFSTTEELSYQTRWLWCRLSWYFSYLLALPQVAKWENKWPQVGGHYFIEQLSKPEAGNFVNYVDYDLAVHPVACEQAEEINTLEIPFLSSIDATANFTNQFSCITWTYIL